MPLPVFARALPRTLNRGVVPLARRCRPLALVHHVGRRSGTGYANPVMALRTARGWVVALPYGSDVNWVANARAAGHVDLTVRGVRQHDLPVHLLSHDEGMAVLPAWSRPVMKLLGVRDVLTLEP
ncbi:nitroreductase family deazaflavin-dependent oxidoreductase [Kineosporia sp. NBRC 101731]|uniref:nitroreductase family deazaflavin-dependent oxidoreductase n=1 Tax=Kineosporia sp. NBRC 101731 TaxID=3032199 RepID=UPI0024A3C4EF|nr:nitroreductase family deazaflavin-dependent oxidoreductase [Kineosporia sp. NBRC 101731]GLY31054.1 hypothetical protein Kisp02_44190 [Kineosporia sp. NBRC 101731]